MLLNKSKAFDLNKTSSSELDETCLKDFSIKTKIDKKIWDMVIPTRNQA